MNPEDVKDLATPGSVWLRTDGAQAKVIFVTNLSLTPQQQVKYPPQVVYADADGKIFGRTLESFASIFTFLNVDPDLEKRVGNLIVFKASDYLTVDDPEDDEEAIVLVDDEDDDEPTPPKEPVQKLTVQVRQPTTAKTIEPKPVIHAKTSREMHVDFKLSDNEGYAQPALTAADLADAIKVYTRQPDEQYKVTVHRLSFALSEKVTIEALKEIFHPSQTVNTIDAFRVRTAFGSEIFVWDSWIGIFPEYSVSGLFATVYVGTADSPIDTQPTPGADVVEVHTHQAGEANANTTAAVDEVVSIEQPQVDVLDQPTVETENDAPVAQVDETPVIVDAAQTLDALAEAIVPSAVTFPDVAPYVEEAPVPTLAEVTVAPEAPVEVQAQVQVTNE